MKDDYKKKRYKRGMDLLKKMGREELMLNQKALSPELYEMSVGHLFGDVWARPGLSLRERQLVGEVIRPNLEGGTSVVCARFADSTLAYQGYGAGAPLDALRVANGVVDPR